MNYQVAIFTSLFLFGASVLSNAQVFIPNDTTINYATNNDVIGGYARQSDLDNRINGTNPTIHCTDDGYLWLDASFYNRSTFQLSGGTVDGILTAYDESSIIQSGGVVSDLMFSTANSHVLITGGIAGNIVSSSDNSQITMTGGQITQGIVARHNSTVFMRGGTLRQFSASENSVINIYGTSLTDVLIAPNILGYREYALSGLLDDGTDIRGVRMYVQNGSNARFHLINSAVPEPGILAAFSSMMIASTIALRRRHHGLCKNKGSV